MDLSIVVPCYNEVDNVPKLQAEFFPVVRELGQTRSVEVVFVDDGSTDGTGQALEDRFVGKMDSGIVVRLERHPVNRGLGAALKTGLAAARGAVVVTTDSDGTYSFSEIPALLASLSPDVDIVTASPYHPAGGVAGVPAYRLVLSRGSSAIYRLLLSRRIHTYTCLFRAYRRQVIENVSFQANGFLAGTELLAKAMLKGYRVVEYPAVLYARRLGVSKAKLLRTILAHLGFQARILLHRIRVASLVESKVAGGKQWA